MNNKLAVVLYTSTKGHFGKKNIYKKTVDRIDNHLNECFLKIAHIKISPEDSEVGEEMEKWLNEKGWIVEKTIGKWSHFDSSHVTEYYLDMLKMMSKKDILKKEYILNLEDDWLVNSENLYEAFGDAIDNLDENPELFCCRVERNGHGTDKKCERLSKFVLRHNLDYSEFGPTFTFQPTILRTRTWNHAVNLLFKQRHLLDALKNGEVHCELLATNLVKSISGSDRPFCSFDMKKVNTTHIGEPDYECE